MDNIVLKRKKEHLKYDETYKNPNYKMGKNRIKAAHAAIRGLGIKGSFLDVGCGRGEIISFAKEEGFSPVTGVDVVDYLLNPSVVYGEAHNLPFADNSFDVVTSFDAFEHFLPEDTELALEELDRVAKHAIVLCIENAESRDNGVILHINRRPYKQWDKLIRKHIHGDVSWVPRVGSTHSETWIILKEEYL